MKKLKKVSVIRHPSGISVDVMMNQNSLEFFATPIKDVYFTEKSAETLRQKVWQYLDKNVKADWTPVIEVNETSPFATTDYAFIGMELDRFYVGKAASGGLRKLRWDDFEENSELDRIVHSQRFHGFEEISFPQHSDTKRDSITHYLAYNESVWTALNQVREAIATLKQQLRDTLNSDAGIKRLEDFGSKMQNLLNN